MASTLAPTLPPMMPPTSVPPIRTNSKLLRRPTNAARQPQTPIGQSKPKSEQDNSSQGIDIVYNKLDSKDKAGKSRDSSAKHNDSKAKQTERAIESEMIDILAIPGLGAHHKQTWIKRRRIAGREGDGLENFKDGPSMIADPTMLPDTCENSRIMTVSYASEWLALGKSEQNQPVSQRLEAVADLILRDLKRLRKNYAKRPILLLGHSLGGVILEKVVVKSKLKSEYLEIYNSIAGCMFLGAPFKGSETQAQAALSAKLGSALPFMQIAEYTPLLELMKKDSQHLADLLTDFLDVSNEAGIQMFCFYELQKSDVSGFYRKLPGGNLLPPSLSLIADEDSSTLQGKEKQGLNRDHYNLNKFESSRDREWITMSSIIQRMANKASKALKERRNALPDKISPEKFQRMLSKLTATEVDPDSNIQTVEDDRGQAIGDSAHLLFQNTKIKSWLEESQKGMLWIPLQPGVSSDIMAVAFKKRLDDELRSSQLDDYLCYFLCDSRDVKRNNTLSILKAFIRQMLNVTKRLALHLPYEQERTQAKKQASGNVPAWDSLANLKVAFLAMLRDPHVNSVTLIVDSLHKIDEDSRPDMLEIIEESLDIGNAESAHAKIKWICLGLDRPDIKTTMQHALTVTSQDLGSPAAILNSLKSLVRNKVTELAYNLDYSREYAFWLRTELLNRAEGITTWVDLACGEIESVKPKSIDVRTFAEHLKQDLKPLYRQIQARILNPNAEGLEYTKEILRTMLILFHNPTLQELAVLAGLPPATWTDTSQIEPYINRCGSFLKIVYGQKDRVHFMDTTAAEYLNNEAANELGHHDRLSIQHAIIALRCLDFMMKAKNEYDTASQIKIFYPKRFWLDHARKSTEELPDLLEDFGLDETFWEVGGSWWPKLRDLKRQFPMIGKLSVVHLAAYFGYPLLLDQLLAEDSIHKEQINAQDALGMTPLYWAAFKGHLEVAKTLIAHGAQINVVSDNKTDGLAPLYGAAQNGHTNVATWLLELGAIVDVPNEKYGTSLIGAASGGHTDVVQILLQAGASRIAPPKWNGGNALTSACYYGHPDTAKLMVKEGFDVNIADSNNIYALQYAVQCADAELVDMLLRYGANMKSRQDALEAAALNGFQEAIRLILRAPAGLTLKKAFIDCARLGYDTALGEFPIHGLTQDILDEALFIASDMEKESVVEKLLFMGASANARGEVYGNALQASTWDGTTKIMELLVAHGADVNAFGGQYGTALQAAAFQGDKNNLLFLLKHGARVNDGPIGEYGNALYAAAAGNNLEAVQTLVEHGAFVNANGGTLNYALLAAASSSNSEMVRYLVDHGADLRCQADDGSNVLLQASYTLPTEDLEYLYNRGAYVHCQDREGNTVLIGCAYYQDVPSVEWLMTLGVNIDAASKDDGTALQAAASNGNEEICEILLKHGANPNRTSDDHPPPLITAAQIDDQETFDVLLKYGANIMYSSEKWGNLVEAAIEGEAREILNTVLEKTAFDVNAMLRDKGTPLHMACCSESSWSIVDLLIDKSADPNITGGKYHTPLQAAATQGSSDIVQILLDHGADKSLAGGFYGKALNAAAACGSSYTMSNLLDDETTSENNEALHYAIHYHQHEIVEELLNEEKADITSSAKWGNVFQALNTPLTSDETDDKDSNDEGDDEDDDNEGEEEEEEYEEDYDDEEEDEEEEQEDDDTELTDEKKIQKIDELLRAEFEKRNIPHESLPKQPLVKFDNRSIPTAYETVGTRALPGMFEQRQNPTFPGQPRSPFVQNSSISSSAGSNLQQFQQAGSKVNAFVGGLFSGNSRETQMTAQRPLSQAVPSRKPVGSLQAQSQPQTQSQLQPQNQPQAPVMQARAVHGHRANSNREVSLLPNEQVTVLDTSHKDWWKVQKPDGSIAYAPAGHLEMVNPQNRQANEVHGQPRGSAVQSGYHSTQGHPQNNAISTRQNTDSQTQQPIYQRAQYSSQHEQDHYNALPRSSNENQPPKSTYQKAEYGHPQEGQTRHVDQPQQAYQPFNQHGGSSLQSHQPDAAQQRAIDVSDPHALQQSQQEYQASDQRGYASQTRQVDYGQTQQLQQPSSGYTGGGFYGSDDFSPEQAQHFHEGDDIRQSGQVGTQIQDDHQPEDDEIEPVEKEQQAERFVAHEEQHEDEADDQEFQDQYSHDDQEQEQDTVEEEDHDQDQYHYQDQHQDEGQGEEQDHDQEQDTQHSEPQSHYDGSAYDQYNQYDQSDQYNQYEQSSHDQGDYQSKFDTSVSVQETGYDGSGYGNDEYDNGGYGYQSNDVVDRSRGWFKNVFS